MKFIRINENLIFEHVSEKPTTILDEIQMIETSIDTNINKDIKIPKDVFDSLELKNELNPELFKEDKIIPKIKNKLIQIAKDFIKDIKLDNNLIIKDIILTGSLANFNWSKFSDVDLHIILDTNQLDMEPDAVVDYLDSKKSLWNQNHDIKILDYSVELYAQDIKDKLVATAIYSLIKDKWIKKPIRKEFNVNKQEIKQKALRFIKQLKDVRKDYQEDDFKRALKKADKLKNKIKQMRNSGLEKGGEFSLENLTFKVLRRTAFLDQLYSLKNKAYDKSMSIL